jgi:hypothetical protein
MNTTHNSTTGTASCQRRSGLGVGAAAVIAAVVVLGGLPLAGAALGMISSALHDASHRLPQPAPMAVPQTQVVVDDRTLAEDDGWTVYRFHLDQASQVREELGVESGDGVTSYLMAANGYPQFLRSQQSLWGGDFLQYQPFCAKGVRRHVAQASLPAGDYVLVIKEMSDQNILGAPDTALTNVKVVATSTRWTVGGRA